MYSSARLGVTNRQLGVVFALSCFAVVAAQFPVVTRLSGSNRMRTYSKMNLAFGLLLALVATASHVGHTVGLVIVGFVLIALGFVETVYGAIRPAMTGELFAPSLHGRAYAAGTFAFGSGLTVTKAGGGALLDRFSSAAWLVFATALALGALLSFRMDATIAAPLRYNP